MKVGAIAIPISDYIVAGESLASAHKKLKAQEMPALPVLQGNTLMGMLSAKDITIANLTEPTVETTSPPRTVGNLKLSGVVSSTEDGDVDALMLKATEKGASYVAVLDEEGKPTALVDLSPYQQHIKPRWSLESNDEILDESLKESFPASDPASPARG